MKKTIKLFGFIAAAAIALVSCAKEENIVDTPTFEHSLTIHATQAATKTVINEGSTSASFLWSSDDASRFTITENGVKGTGVSLTSTDSYATMMLSATFATETASTYEYAAFLAKNTTNGGAPKIPAAQTSTNSTYDPNADILVAKTQSFSTVQSELEMEFARPVVINKMTLKGLDKDEAISSITVSADKDIVGYYTIGTDTWSGQGSEITISTEQTVPASGEVTVFFVTMPVSAATLNVTVTTGNYIYSKQFTKTINFVVDQVTKFGVGSFSRTDKLNYNGTYVLANTTGTAMAGAWAGGNSIPEVTSYVESDVIYYDPDAVDIDEAKVTLAKETDTASDYYGMYTILQNGEYLYAASNSANQLKGESTPDVNAYWEVSEDSGVWTIVASKSSNRNILRYNSGNKIFSCYASGQEDVKLFTSWAPTPVITADNIAITSDEVTSTNTGATFNSNTATVTAAAYDDSGLTTASTWLTVSVSGTTVNYAASANTGAERTGYIKITATNSDSHSVEKVITVTQDKPGNTNKVDILNQSWTGVTGTSYSAVTDLAGSASDAVYSVQCAGGNSSIQLRSNNNNSGIVTTTSGGKVKKITVTWGSGNADNRTLDIYGKSSAYTAPSDLYSSSTRGTKLGSIVYGTSTVLEITDDYEYVGLRSNSGAMYLSEVKIEWETGSGSSSNPTYSVTWDAPTETGCSISATVGGNAITSGDEFEEGTIVTISATAGSGYTFGGWTITGASAANASSASTTVTIGTSNVTLDATFNTSGGGGNGGTVTFTFGDNITATSGTISPITLSSANSNTVNSNTGNAPAYNSSSEELRIYRYGSLTLSSTSTITGITITYSSTSYLGSDTNSNVGSYSASGTTGTWTGSATSVTINNVGTTNVQMRIKSIAVTYE